jgi:hypothetical protein
MFCGDCGHPASAHTQAAAAPAKTAPVAPAGFAPASSYSAAISRQNPGLLIFLVDRSGSMDEPIAGGSGQKKQQVVADAINRLLYNTVLRCAKEDGVRPYFDVGVWGYGGNAEVQPAFGSDLLSITQIAERPIRTETRRRRMPDGAGGVYEEEFQLPVWFDPAANGNTPMNAAFRTALRAVVGWVAAHPQSFPPILINLTDGKYTDGSPTAAVDELKQTGTNDGAALIFNCHISVEGGAAISFPGDAEAGALTGLARELFDLSSRLPEPMRLQGVAKGYTIQPGGRGYAFNADLVTMIDFLDIGTRVVQDRMETA